jgi:hypothetical protein
VNVQEFAGFLRIQKGTGTALLIGFDGGAALVNHHRPVMVRDAVCGSAATNAFSLRHIKNAWRSGYMDYTTRDAFMRAHTTTTDAAEPDLGAIGCLARLVEQDYVRAVVSTDSSRVLYDSLTSCGVAIEQLICSSSVPKALQVRSNGKVFVDAGELLLTGFDPDIYGRADVELGRMRDTLKEFLGSYRCLYCWGWCELNAQIDWVCPAKGLPYFTAIGDYTDVTLQTDWNVVEGARDTDHATNDIWYELDRLLFPARTAPARPTAPRQSGPAPPVSLADRSAQRRPLLSQETFRDLVDRVSGATVSFIGAESSSVRMRCAHWMATMLRQRGQQPLFCSSTDPADLGRFMTMIGESGNNEMTWAIGVLDNGIGDRAQWASVLLPALRRWRELADKGSGTHDYHVVLFAPLPVADWVNAQFAREERFWVRSFFTPDFLVTEVVAEWLVENVGPLAEQLDSAGARTLALQMVNDANAVGGRPADWLHEAIDFWYLNTVRAAQGIDDGIDAESHEISLGDLVNLWDELGRTYRRVDDGLRLDFDLGTAHPRDIGSHDRAEAEDEQQTFRLGSISPRAESQGRPVSPEAQASAGEGTSDAGESEETGEEAGGPGEPEET